MDSSESLVYIVVGTIIWLVILYTIINLAVKSAGRYQSHNIKMLLRMKAKQMRKQGFSYQEIRDLYTDEDEAFWIKLRDENP